MSQSPSSLGFLTVLHEPSGYLGGYLVTNGWGRPLEFRLSSAVQPNRVQQILYASTLQSYLYADLIGKTLVEKAGTTVQLVITDREPVLDLRRCLPVPVVWLAPAEEAQDNSAAMAQGPRDGHGPILCHPGFAGDVPLVQEMLSAMDGSVDLAEPFARIREAIGEARKMGVASR